MFDHIIMLARCLTNVFRKGLPDSLLSAWALSDPEIGRVAGGMSDQGDTY